MIRIKTVEDGEVRKINLEEIAEDVRITTRNCPEHIERIEDVKVVTIVISKKTFIKAMQKFLEELEA